MGCIVATGRRVGQSLRAYAERVGESLEASAMRVGGNLRITAGLVCSVGEDRRLIYWGKDVVLFTSADNKVGTIKFNTLTAKGDWVLSEVTIEELL